MNEETEIGLQESILKINTKKDIKDLKDGILIRTIFKYCKIKKITLDEFTEQISMYKYTNGGR